ncbi:MAG: hypothetical protein KIS87_09690 [Phycisphaeraceae bacterium]|nr:hypothetical protein [Phycisphaeraceae bacterium]
MIDLDEERGEHPKHTPSAGGGGDILRHTPNKPTNSSHSRGEPRFLALAWTVFLLLSTLAAFATVGAGGAGNVDAYRPAARGLLVTVAVGVALLWPMMRLAQSVPSGGLRGCAIATMRDLVVLLVPMQAVIWPQALLARWPLDAVAAIAVSLAVWTVLIGGVLAFCLALGGRSEGNGWRWWAMLGIAVLVNAVPAIGVALASVASSARPRGLWLMASPMTAVVELTQDRSWRGRSLEVEGTHWRAIVVVGGIASAAWLPLIGAAVARRPEAG